MSRNARGSEAAAQRAIPSGAQTQPPSRRQYATTIFLLNPPRELLWAATAYRQQQQSRQQQETEQQYHAGRTCFEERHRSDNGNEKELPQKQFDQYENGILSVQRESQLAENTQQLAHTQDICDEEEKNLFIIKNISETNDDDNSTTVDNLLSGRAERPNDFTPLCGFENDTSVSKRRAASLSSSCSVSSPSATFTSSDETPAPSAHTEVSQPLAVVPPRDAWHNAVDCGGARRSNGNDEVIACLQHRQLIETLLKTFSRQRRRRRASIGDHATSTGAQVGNKRQVVHSQAQVSGVALRFRVPSILASPRQLMPNSLRGLRRAASSASSINCCSNQSDAPPTASYATNASTALLSAANIYAAHTAYPYPRSHTPLMVLPSRAGTTTTVYLPSHVASPAFSSQSSLLSASRYGSRDNNYFGDNNKAIDLSHTTADSSYGSEWSASSTEQPAGYNGTVDESQAVPTVALGNEEPHNQPLYSFATRPPLNRAIPPIPESKSNESIISAHAHSHNVYLRSTPTQPLHLLPVHDKTDANSINNYNEKNENNNLKNDNKELNTNGAVNLMSVSATVKDASARGSISSVPRSGETSSVKNGEREHLLAKRKGAPPKSPLTSMAHIMRNRFSKLGTRFVRNYDSDSPTRAAVRSSKSMQAMKRDTSSSEFAVAKSRIGRPSAAVSKLPKSQSLGSKGQDAPRSRPNIELVSDNSSAGWYASDAMAVPRRLPSTTLIPSAMGLRSLPTRLPPDDLPLAPPLPPSSLLIAAPTHSILKNNSINNNKENKLDLNNNDCNMVNNETKVTTPSSHSDDMSPSVPLSATNTFEECANRRVVHFGVMLSRSPVTLRRANELEFIQLDYGGGVYAPCSTTAAVTVDDELRNIDDESLLMEDSPARAKAALPLRRGEKPSGSDLWRVPVASDSSCGMRKTPSSFPPMPVSICAASTGRQRQPPRSLSIGVGDSDSRRALHNGKMSPPVVEKRVQRNESFQTTRRSIFSTHSLRQAASRIVEASPRLRRRTRAASATPYCDEGREFVPTEAVAVVKVSEMEDRKLSSERRRRRVFRKSVSLPESKALKKPKSKKEKENYNNAQRHRAFSFALHDVNEKNGGQQPTVPAKEFEIRTINSVLQKRGNQRAPLAEIESSRVAENSPAVELPPLCAIAAFHQQRQATRAKFTPAHWKTTTSTTKDNKTDELRTTITSSDNNNHDNSNNNEDDDDKDNNNEASENSALPLSLVDVLFDHDGKPPPPPPSQPPPPSVILTDSRDETNSDQQTRLSGSEIALIDDVSCSSSASLTLRTALPVASVTPTKSLPIARKPSRIAKWNWGRSKQQKLEKQNQESQSKKSTTKGTINQSNKVAMMARRDGGALTSYDSSESSGSNLRLSMERNADSTARLDARLERMRLRKGLVEIRASASHFSAQQPLQQVRKTSATTTSKKSSINVIQRKTQPCENGRAVDRTCGPAGDEKSVDDVQLEMHAADEDGPALPEILADFKTQLSTLQYEIHNDYAEIERLRVENEELQKKIESRDAIIEALRIQLEASGKL